jgi:hypothetical protein
MTHFDFVYVVVDRFLLLHRFSIGSARCLHHAHTHHATNNDDTFTHTLTVIVMTFRWPTHARGSMRACESRTVRSDSNAACGARDHAVDAHARTALTFK